MRDSIGRLLECHNGTKVRRVGSGMEIITITNSIDEGNDVSTDDSDRECADNYVVKTVKINFGAQTAKLKCVKLREYFLIQV